MGVQALGYLEIEATEPAKWDSYLTQVVGAMPAGGGMYRIDSRPFRFVISQSEADRFAIAGWETADEYAFETMLERLNAAGRPVERLDPELRHVKGLARSSDPEGNRFEVFHGAHATIIKFASPAGVSGFVTGENGRLGMGHIVYAAQDFETLHGFYRDVMGFHDTDLPSFDLGLPGMPPLNAAFMHGTAGRHHSVAVMGMPPSPAGCIHIMVETATMDDVGHAYDRMRTENVPVSATLGRHVNDQVTSFYMQTPGGFDLEMGWGGLIVDPASWEVTQHDSISIWGHVWSWQEAMKAQMAQQ